MIKYSPSTFKSATQAKEFVAECDKNFGQQLSNLTEAIGKLKNIKVMTLSGPTCSGKTTASKKILSDFKRISKRINIVSIDDFYYDKDRLLEISNAKGLKSVDYDSVDTIDIEALKHVIDEIFDQKQSLVHCPVFDFVEGKRVGFRTLECTDNDIFLFEGIQALYPEIHDLLDDHGYCDIYICPQSQLCVDGIVFEPNELRLMRRLVRDSNFRGTSAEFTFNMWDSVRHNEDVNIFPYSSVCKYKIDSVFPCEISLLKPYLDNLLDTVNPDSVHYEKAVSILDKIKHVDSLPKEYLAEDSIYREFI